MAVSLVRAPYFFSATKFSEDIELLPEKPIPLFRHGRTCVYYTSQDLLHPEIYGKPGEYFQALIFDVWPKDEGHTTSGGGLTWIRQITKALAVLDAEGNPILNIQATSRDKTLADRFQSRFSGSPELPRGSILPFPVIPEATYRKTSGVQCLIAAAVRDPENLGDTNISKGRNPLFAQSLRLAFDYVANNNLSGIGVPLIMIPAFVRQSALRSESWEKILEEVDRIAGKTSIAAVVLGGYGVVHESREKTDEAFRQAWKNWQIKLESESGQLVHKELRFSTLIVLAAFTGASLRKKAFKLKRLIAMSIVATSLSASVGKVLDWGQSFLPDVGNLALIVVGLLLAITAGVFIDQIIAFEPEKEL